MYSEISQTSAVCVAGGPWCAWELDKESGIPACGCCESLILATLPLTVNCWWLTWKGHLNFLLLFMGFPCFYHHCLMILPKSCEAEKTGVTPCSCEDLRLTLISVGRGRIRASFTVQSVHCPFHCHIGHQVVSAFVTAVSQWCVAAPFSTACLVSFSPRYYVSSKKERSQLLGYLTVIILGILLSFFFLNPCEGRVPKLFLVLLSILCFIITGIIIILELDMISAHMRENHMLVFPSLCCFLRAEPSALNLSSESLVEQ